MRNVIVLFLFLTSFSVNAQISDSIIIRLGSKWDWVDTHDGWGYYNSPQIAGYTKSVVFSQTPLDEGTDTISYSLFRNDIPIYSGRTYLSDLNYWGGHIHANVIGEDSLWFSISEYFIFSFSPLDTNIYIGPDALDANIHTYRKDTSYNGIHLLHAEIASIIVHPNPTSHSFSIQLPPTFGTLEKLEIFNSFGQMVGRYKTVENIDVSGYPKGLYFVVVTGEDGERMTGRVVKE